MHFECISENFGLMWQKNHNGCRPASVRRQVRRQEDFNDQEKNCFCTNYTSNLNYFCKNKNVFEKSARPN